MKTEIKEHFDRITQEKYYSFRHKSGVSVLVSPNAYSTASAIYTSDYGGSDVSFTYNGKRYDTPRGIAHFLEHKLFETEDGGDAFKLFSKLGADSNAFTSHRATSYTFTSTVGDFYESLKILLDFVHHPHFTEASVSKERGIIAEELKMYDDNPDNRCYYELMKCLYKNNNVRYDVGGTLDSIKEITPELLYFCHRVFYSPDNMSLIVSGDVDIKKITDIMDKTVPAIRGGRVVKLKETEPEKAYKKLSVTETEVSSPLFGFGIKDKMTGSKKLTRRKSVALSVLADMLLGESSEFFCKNYESGLLTGGCDVGYSCAGDHAYLSVFGESEKPFTVKKRIINVLEKALSEGIDRYEFERCKKIFYSNFIYSTQNSHSVAHTLLSFYQSGDDLTKYPALLSGVNADFALECLRELYKKERTAFAVVKPKNKEEK